MTGHWAALLPATEAQAGLHPVGAHELGLGMLAFSPRVAVFEEAVLIEAQASLRLFGGAAALHRQVADLATALGVCDLGWAPTGLAALAKARARALHRQGAPRIGGLAASADAVGLDGEQPDLEGVAIPWLDRLPLQVLSAVARHRPTLARLGCQTLGDVRRLPRAGLARRFDAELLDALDQAYGLQPESHVWLSLPDVFEARLELLAASDALTGIANRREFTRRLQLAWDDHAERDVPLAVLLIDVDEFKAYNDSYGHLGGDAALATLAAALATSLRGSGDLAARYGGEEFAILLPDCDADAALALARQLVADVQRLALPHRASSVAHVVTVSIGAASLRPAHGRNPDALLHAADAALYCAKAEGRNRALPAK